MFYSPTAALSKIQLCQNHHATNKLHVATNGKRFCISTPIKVESGKGDADGEESKPIVPLHNCLHQHEKCTFKNCELNIYENVVVKEELIISDYEDSESVIENYYYDSFEKWSEFGQPLKTFLQNTNFNDHPDEENYMADKMLEDNLSNNSSNDESFGNSVAGSCDKSIVIRNTEWMLEKVFKNEILAQSYMEEEKIWSLRVRYNTHIGMKSIYRCNLVKNKMPQCAAKLYLEYHKDSGQVLLYSNRCKHTHASILLDASSSDRQIHRKIKELADLGLSSYEIELHLENNGFNVSSNAELTKYVPAPEARPEYELMPEKIEPKIEIDDIDYDDKPKELDNSNYKPRGDSKWIFERTFRNSDRALEYIKNCGIWSKFSKNRNIKSGIKQFYRCNRVPKHGPQCASQKYIHIDNKTGVASMYGTTEHTHDAILSMRQTNVTNKNMMNKILIKKEPESDSENTESMHYEYYGYNNFERALEEMGEGPASSRPYDDTKSWQAFFHPLSEEANGDIKNNNANDRLSNLTPQKEEIDKNNWTLDRTFSNRADANLFLDGQNIWALKQRQTNHIGLKCIYRCGLIDTTMPQCAAYACVQYQSDNDEVLFYTNGKSHTHEELILRCLKNESEESYGGHHMLRGRKLKQPSYVDKVVEPPTTLRKGKRRFLPWRVEKKFQTHACALEYMKIKSTWTLWKKRKYKDGSTTKDYYRCTIKSRRTGGLCPAQKYMLCDKVNNLIILYHCHTHEHDTSSPTPADDTDEDSSLDDTLDVGNTTEEVTIRDDTLNNKSNKDETINEETTNAEIIKAETINEESIKDQTVNDETVEEEIIKNDSITEKFITDENAEESPLNSTELSCGTNGSWGKNWILEKNFENLPVALKYMKNEEIWSICSKLKVFSGYRQYYRCNLVKLSGPQCDARKYLFFNSPTKEVLLYGCNSHTHELILAQHRESQIAEDGTPLDDSDGREGYAFEKKFINSKQALVYIKTGKKWTHRTKIKSRSGYRQYFRCNFGKVKNGPWQCEARKCLSFKYSKNEVILYSRYGHSHEVKDFKCNEPNSSLADAKSKQQQMSTWTLERNFLNSAKALHYIKKSKIWSICSKRKTTTGNYIQYYRCNIVKKTGPQCAAGKYLLFHSRFAKVSMYGRYDHTHDAIIDGTYLENSDETQNNEPTQYENSVEDNSNNIECSNGDAEDEEPLNENLYAVDVVIDEEPAADEPDHVKHKRRRPYSSKKYVFEKKFRNCKTASAYIKSQQIWSVVFMGRTEFGYRKRFRCNLVKRSGPQCAARKYLICESNTCVQVMASAQGHTHDLILAQEKGENHFMIEGIDSLNTTSEEKGNVPTRIKRKYTKRQGFHDSVDNDPDFVAGPAKKRKYTKSKTKKKQCRKRKIYAFERKFKNATTALNFMKSEREWGRSSKAIGTNYVKQFYRCKLVMVGGPQCAAGRFLLYSKTKKEVMLYICNEHTHDSILLNQPTKWKRKPKNDSHITEQSHTSPFAEETTISSEPE